MNTLKLDHIAISGETRDEARAHIEEALGVSMQAGGAHARFGTHNHLMGLVDGLYLEAISVDSNAPDPERARWFDLDNFRGVPRLTNWICSVPDMSAACSHWPEAGDPVALERGELKWQMAVPENGTLTFDGLFPPLIEWQGDLHPAAMLEPTGARLSMLTIRHPKAEALASLLGAVEPALLRFERAAKPELIAEIQTPHGLRVLA